MGLEPTRAEPNGLAVHRLNHSATSSPLTWLRLLWFCAASRCAACRAMLVITCNVKPATGRPYVRAFSLSGTVPAFTCDCLRFVCAFTPRPKVDLCVSTFSRTMLAFGNNVSFSSSACSTLASCRRQHGREYAGVQTFPVDRKHSDCSKALRNPHKFDLCVLASFSCHVYAETQGRKLRPVAAFTVACQILIINVGLFTGSETR